jgi:hypothetical protein
MKPLELIGALQPGSGIRLVSGLAEHDAITRVDLNPQAIAHREHRSHRSPLRKLDDQVTRLEEMGFPIKYEVTMRAPFVASAKVAHTTFRCEALTQDLAVHALLKALGETT